MIIYMVQEVNSYGGWGETHYGDVLAVFDSREKAEEYCYEHHLTSLMSGGWPSIIITKKEIK